MSYNSISSLFSRSERKQAGRGEGSKCKMDGVVTERNHAYILDSTRNCLCWLRHSAAEVSLPIVKCRVILRSAVFSIKLYDLLHKFLYNRIKQYYIHMTNPTIYLQYYLGHYCELRTTRKRKEKDQLGDHCRDIFAQLIKKLEKQNKTYLVDSQTLSQ